MRPSSQLTLALIFMVGLAVAQPYNDPNFPKPTSGYGSDGSYTVDKLEYDHPYFSGETIEVFYPKEKPGKVPTIFFCHGFGGVNSLYINGMIQFLAKKGYALVYVPYPTTGVSIEERYDILREGFRHAARKYPQIIDTTKVGFMGHSFGGGAMFGVSHACFTQNNWGSAGRFLFSLAPWYSYQLSPEQLNSFPANTQLIMHVYEEDVLNDHRMAIDIFNNINIPKENKDYIYVQPDTINGTVYPAGHNLPGTYEVYDAMDYYAFYRLLDAMCDYVFNGNTEAKKTALGNGSAEQVTMPGNLKPLLQSDEPGPLFDQSFYEFPCDAILNPRRMFCGLTSATDEKTSSTFIIYPNPARDHVTLSNLPSQNTTITITGILGRKIKTLPTEGNTTIDIDISDFRKGIYLVTVDGISKKMVISHR
ncbi:MAG TPA: T9SS type A sorting domain-containing protein [Saprospiraceae bacterium]|nr:T9SS type A sorting domain-containing protein [Saprospiraceae bacterium]HRG65025.1 T9SS type A sorting domain-containing protein [Saprospiraceae bacterium]